MLTVMMIAVWSGIGALGLLLLTNAVRDDETQAEEDGEHDVPDRGE